MKYLVTVLMLLTCSVCVSDDVVFRNGVQCHRRLVPIHGSSDYRVEYEPIVVKESVVEKVETPAPYSLPTEDELIGLPQDEYEKRLLGIIERSVRDQSRREDIKILRSMGLSIGEPDSGSSVYAKSVYSRGYERPIEQNFGISVRESIDFVGSDPTDLIANQIGRNIDGVRGLFGDLTTAQSDALRELIKSRQINTERIARAIEETARGNADTQRIRALADATKRSHVDRDVNITGTFLQHLTEQLAGQSGGAASTGDGGNQGDIGKVQEIINQKCGKCHDSSRSTFKEGRLDLKNYGELQFDQLSSVVRRIRSGSMPPDGEPDLTAEEEAAIVDDFVNASTSNN